MWCRTIDLINGVIKLFRNYMAKTKEVLRKLICKLKSKYKMNFSFSGQGGGSWINGSRRYFLFLISCINIGTGAAKCQSFRLQMMLEEQCLTNLWLTFYLFIFRNDKESGDPKHKFKCLCIDAGNLFTLLEKE